MASELLSGDKKIIKISAKCYNPANYNEDGKDNMLGIGKAETEAWGYDCHRDVGKIKVTNAAGQVKQFTPKKTPNKRDEVVDMFSFDPCTLQRVTVRPPRTETPAPTK